MLIIFVVKRRKVCKMKKNTGVIQEAEILKCFEVTEDGLTEEKAEKILNEKQKMY